MFKSFIIACFVVFMGSYNVYAQCCGMGSPIGGSANAGILNSNTIRVSSFYKYGFFETYYHGNIRLINYGPIKNSSYNFLNLSLAYGITKKLSIENEAGYFINKTQHYNDSNLDKYAQAGFGFSSGTLSFKYGVFIKPRSEFEFTVGLGLKYPFSTKAQMLNNIRLPLDVQPSPRAYGLVTQIFIKKSFSPKNLSLIFVNRFEKNAANPDKYISGSMNISSLFITKKIANNLIGVLQLRNDVKYSDRTENTNETLLSEGSHLIYVVPQLTYAIRGKLIVSAFFDAPIYKYYKGKADYKIGSGGQISNKYAMGITLTKDFSLVKKITK